jgi:CheY-like chemotaxis protein
MTITNSFIMIIDDNSSDLDLIKRAFEINHKSGKLLCMNNSKDALAYLMGDGVFADRENHPFPSMLITDIKMPGVDGFDILEYLQNNPTRIIIPSIVLSSSTAYKLGAYSYFVKPFKYEDLCDLISLIIAYWKNTKSPLKDASGKQIITDSSGKMGARYVMPN